MVSSFLQLLLLLVLSATSLAETTPQKTDLYLYKNDPDASPVMDHTDEENFEDFIDVPRLVEFYSPYCGGCRHFKPTYIELAKTLTKEYMGVKVYAVSCAAHKDMCTKHSIKGYPSLFAFPAKAKEGVYLQKSSMGGTYSTNAIAESLGLEVSATAESRKLVNDEEDDEEEEDEKEEEDDKEQEADEEEEEEEEATATEKEEDEEEEETETDKEEEEEEEEETETDKEEDEKEEEKEDEGEDEEEEKDGKPEDEEEEEEKDDKPEEEEEEEENPEHGPEDKADATPDEDEEEEEEITKGEIKEEKEDEEDDDDATTPQERHDATDSEDINDRTRGSNTVFSTKTSKEGGLAAASDFRSSLGRHTNTGFGLHGGIKPAAGAESGKLKPRDMDRWKELIELRKQKIEKQKQKGSFLRPKSTSKVSAGPGGKVTLDKPATAGTTTTMRKYTPGSEEYEKRKKEILERVEKAKSKGHFNPFRSKEKIDLTDVKKDKLPYQRDVRKPSFVQKVVEKVPVVKRIVKMTPEEELILDASLSFVTGLRHGVFMSPDPLTEEKKGALKSYLDLLSVSLPLEWGLHFMIADLANNINHISKTRAYLDEIIMRHPLPRQAWSKSCDKKGTGGFSCGMWKLFHIVTVGAAEQRGGLNLVDAKLIEPYTKTFSPAEAAGVFRNYMVNFFGCTDCRENFVRDFDECKFRRCDRLTDNADTATSDDWKQLALWMWEAHNEVSVRVANEKVKRLQNTLNSKRLSTQSITLDAKKEDEIKVLWPSIEDCLVCFDDNGKWNEDSVFELLERAYWDGPMTKVDRLLTLRKMEGEDPTGGGFIWIMILVVAGVIYGLRKHLDSQSVGRVISQVSVQGARAKIGDVVKGKKRTA